MPFPATIQAEVSALNASITAALPLESARQRTIIALSTQADMLVNDIDAAIGANAGSLDDFEAEVMPPAIVLDVLTVADAAETQLSLCDLEGVMGRIASNITNG